MGVLAFSHLFMIVRLNRTFDNALDLAVFEHSIRKPLSLAARGLSCF